jgi:hypothetical protein
MTAFALISFAMAALLASSWAPALALAVQLGDQDFANGAITALFNPPSVGEPVPFDQFRGDDNAIDFSESWTFNFPPGPYTSGTITIGIFDHDSASPGSQLASFGFDGNDLTAALDLLFESSGGAQLEVNVYTVALPAATLADLADGSATFALTLQGPTLSGLGVVLPNNGAGLDFSRLDLEGTRVSAPSAAALLLTGLLVLAMTRARSRPHADVRRAHQSLGRDAS